MSERVYHKNPPDGGHLCERDILTESKSSYFLSELNLFAWNRCLDFRDWYSWCEIHKQSITCLIQECTNVHNHGLLLGWHRNLVVTYDGHETRFRLCQSEFDASTHAWPLAEWQIDRLVSVTAFFFGESIRIEYFRIRIMFRVPMNERRGKCIFSAFQFEICDFDLHMESACGYLHRSTWINGDRLRLAFQQWQRILFGANFTDQRRHHIQSHRLMYHHIEILHFL